MQGVTAGRGEAVEAVSVPICSWVDRDRWSHILPQAGKATLFVHRLTLEVGFRLRQNNIVVSEHM